MVNQFFMSSMGVNCFLLIDVVVTGDLIAAVYEWALKQDKNSYVLCKEL